VQGCDQLSIAVSGARDTFANGINNQGDIVGSSNNPGTASGFLLYGGVLTSFRVPGASFTEAHGINNAGTIVALTGRDRIAPDCGLGATEAPGPARSALRHLVTPSALPDVTLGRGDASESDKDVVHENRAHIERRGM
jgi:uncharacterized membrane protein